MATDKPRRICSIDGCGRTHYAKTWCARHYDQAKKHDGNPLGFGRKITVHNQPDRSCTECKQFLPGAAFALGQGICRKCRQKFARNNYSLGKTCSVCSAAIVNASTSGLCRRHWVSPKKTEPRRFINFSGYAVLTAHHDHPNATVRGEILEHVKVMAEAIGRPLVAGENVHHINGVRDDNRLENLELWSTSQPPGQRVEDKVAWAKEILTRYEPSSLNVT